VPTPGHRAARKRRLSESTVELSVLQHFNRHHLAAGFGLRSDSELQRFRAGVERAARDSRPRGTPRGTCAQQLTQQGGGLAYLMHHDLEFRGVRQGHLVEARARSSSRMDCRSRPRTRRGPIATDRRWAAIVAGNVDSAAASSPPRPCEVPPGGCRSRYDQHMARLFRVDHRAACVTTT